MKNILLIFLGLSLTAHSQVNKKNDEKELKVTSKKMKSVKPANQQIKYESIWSMYSDKKLNKMPKYNIEEAESYSTFTYNGNTKILQIQTSSPDGNDTNSIKIDNINKNGNTTTYAGKNNSSKMIISVNNVSKWIEVTNITDGRSVFEYHKIN